MTAKERETVQAFFNRYTAISKERDEAFKKLQEMNKAHGSGHCWCCAWTNLEDIMKNCKDQTIKGRAQGQYDRYVKASGNIDLLTEFGQEMANIGFWKKGGE